MKKSKTKRNAVSKTKAPKNKASDWDTLRELIAEYAEAYVADSWKGGGDPLSFKEIELNLQLQTERLNNYISRMERDYAGT